MAEDIDSAAAIAKKFGYRVKTVSLDGQVINPGGSLTGGSLIKNAGLLSRSTDIKNYELEAEKLVKRSGELSEKLSEAESASAAVEAEITALNAEITVLNEDKIRTLSELKRIEDLKAGIETSLKRLEDEKHTGEERIAKLRETSAEAAHSIAGLDSEKSEVQSEIDKMTGGRDSLNGERESLAAEITALKLSLIESRKDTQAIEAAAENLKSLINDRARRVSEINSETAAINEKNSALGLIIEEKKASADSLRIKIAESESLISELIEKRNQTEKAGLELRTGEREELSRREQTGGELARLTERREVMLREYDSVISQLYDEYQLTRSEAEKIGLRIEKPSEAKKNLADIKSKIRSLGSVNVSAIEEYKEVSERYNFLSAQINDVEATRAELHKLINQLTSQMQEIFTEGFAKINENFSKTFTELFGGGSASLTLSEPENVLESGIDINVKLPGKNVPSLDGLSGGEKALIALSIYFAIMRVNAPPFCFLDEVDTALDDINVERFADYMKRSDFSTQFICVTHRRGTMEAADMLYGVTMQEKGVTKLLELNVSELEKALLENKGA